MVSPTQLMLMISLDKKLNLLINYLHGNDYQCDKMLKLEVAQSFPKVAQKEALKIEKFENVTQDNLTDIIRIINAPPIQMDSL